MEILKKIIYMSDLMEVDVIKYVKINVENLLNRVNLVVLIAKKETEMIALSCLNQVYRTA
jgi:hypothetical protein